ncbi:MAG TPA: hypothetical protein VKT75_19930 [Acidobacteriaceae bacterium]|nr:hypothetical protein [Acidobacteriaceae bacterium]
MVAGTFAEPPGGCIFSASQAVAVAMLAAFLLVRSVAQTSPATVLESVRASALAYSSKLPDFICTQVTRRDVWNANDNGLFGTGISGRGPLGAAPIPATGTGREIVEQVTYFDQKENYQVLAIDGKQVTGISHLQLQGAITAGEFGTALHDIFDPASGTTFTEGRMIKLHGRPAWTFGFRVPKEHGNIVLLRNPDRETVVAYSGEIFVDAASLGVLRVHSVLDLPRGLPLQHAETTVDYKPVAIAGRTYNLPWHSDVRLQDLSHNYINTIEFRHYHEFVAETKILGGSSVH